MPFEYAVRPFASPDAHGRVHIPSAPGGNIQRATLTWGAKTSLDAIGKKGISVTGSWPNDSDAACTEESLQQTQELDPVTVTNEGPNGGTVAFQRARILTLDKEKRSNPTPTPQTSAATAAVLKSYETLAPQMGPRQPQIERCGVTADFNNV